MTQLELEPRTSRNKAWSITVTLTCSARGNVRYLLHVSRIYRVLRKGLYNFENLYEFIQDMNSVLKHTEFYLGYYG
jgi:hypothetical protein